MYTAETDPQLLELNANFKYSLCTHKSISVVNSNTRGILFSLQDITSFLEEFDLSALTSLIVRHVRRTFRCFPYGVDMTCFQELINQLYGFRPEKVLGAHTWLKILMENGFLIFKTRNQLGETVDVLICFDTNPLYKNEYMESNNVNIDYRRVLKHAAGYRELFIALLSQHPDGIVMLSLCIFFMCVCVCVFLHLCACVWWSVYVQK